MNGPRDVGRLAGLRVPTASKVINSKGFVSIKLTECVHSAMAALDHHLAQVARSLKVGQAQTIGIVIPDVTNPFFTDVIRAREIEAHPASEPDGDSPRRNTP